MKRSPLRRFTELARAPFKRRTKPIRQRARKPRHDVKPEDRERLDWLHEQPSSEMGGDAYSLACASYLAA